MKPSFLSYTKPILTTMIQTKDPEPGFVTMEKAIAEGKEIPVTISAKDLSKILSAEFSNGFTFTNGVTGASITWTADGYVNKEAIKYVIKEANDAQ